MTTSPVLPVQPTERIQIVDILRGFALFGILFVNVNRFYYGPAEWLWRSLTYLKPQPMKRTN